MTDQTADRRSLTVDDIDMLESVVEAYWQRHSTAGSLHIVLDDGNWNRRSIEFCVGFAREHGDHVGEAIAKMLLQAPDEVIQECNESDWRFGLQTWREMVCK